VLFNSHIFLFVFLPLVFVAFELAPKKLKLWVLFLASMVFYGYSGIKPLAAMIVSIFWVHGVTYYRDLVPRSLAKLLLVAVPLSILFLFRYLNFALDSFGIPENTRQGFSFFLDVLVPAGISFYTFQIIAYGLDVIDRAIERETKFLNLVTFMSFFPQLIAGPIVRYNQVRDQFEAIRLKGPLARNFADAMQLVVIGLVYKVFIADAMGQLHGKVNLTNGGTLDVWLAVLIYSFQIYYDFYGYSLIAIGLGKLFGIDLPVNFERPYMAPNFKLFWKRWHITLSMWLRDYVYIRLGGNNNYIRNILIVFAAVGLWHGADWSFVVWGLYHAALVIGYKLTRPVWDRAPIALQIAVCFILVSLGWPLFYLDINGYLALLPRLVTITEELRQIYQIQEIGFIGLVALWTFLPGPIGGKIKSWLWNVSKLPVFQASIVVVLILMLANTADFIYFRF